LRLAEDALAALPADLAAETAPALSGAETLFSSGEADPSDPLLLRSRIIEGEQAWLHARAAVAPARIEAALALETGYLLPEGWE
jgi:hypothetical protein